MKDRKKLIYGFESADKLSGSLFYSPKHWKSWEMLALLSRFFGSHFNETAEGIFTLGI